MLLQFPAEECSAMDDLPKRAIASASKRTLVELGVLKIHYPDVSHWYPIAFCICCC